MPEIRLKVLTKESSEYGRYSSYYTNLCAFGPGDNIKPRMIAPRKGWLPKAVGKLFSLAVGNSHGNQPNACAQFEFLTALSLDSGAIGHIANVEDHPWLIKTRHAVNRRWLATMHFPPSFWEPELAKGLRHFQHVFTLCRRDADYLSQWMPRERLSCILHGVDSDFFHPDKSARSVEPRIAFVGKWLRDFDAAGIVLMQALDRWPTLTVDLVVASKWTKKTKLANLTNHPRVRWLESISDEALRQVYREAWIFFLPLQETSANNALVEAMACGVPPVVNPIGGVSDYGGGSVFPVTQGNRPEDYMAMLEDYINNPAQLDSLGTACRQFTIDHLNWNNIRAEHRRVYETVANANGANPL